MNPDITLWKVLESETLAAKAATPARHVFTYVDLTSKELLPVWLSPEAVGGKSMATQEEILDGNMQLGTLNDLGLALKKATAAPRAFRSLNQWHACFQRYAVVAVCTEQVTMSWTLSHLNQILKLAETERLQGRSVLLAVLYDDLVRRSWARRVEARDDSFNMADEVRTLDKTVLEAARARLDQTTSHHRAAAPNRGPSEMGMMTKQVAAFENMQKRAEQVQKLMTSQASQMQARIEAMGAGGGTHKKGGGKWDSKNHGGQQKKHQQNGWVHKGKGDHGKQKQWYDQMKQRKQAKGTWE